MATKKEAGAGRGFVNPKPVNVSDEDYVTPKQQMDAEEEVRDRRMREAATKAYNKAAGYAKGGKINPFMGKESKSEERKEKRLSPAKYRAGERAEGEGMKCGGKVKKMASGGFVRSADGIAQKGKTRGRLV